MSAAKIINVESLWKPLSLVAIDVAFLYHVRRQAFQNVGLHEVYTDSILVPLVMNVIYLLMIFCGCRWMKTREPFEIKSHMFVYNLYQTVMNFFIMAGLLYEVHATGIKYWGGPIDRSAKGLGLGFMIYAHYHNKYVEYFDTLFMVLRKKNNQISFLHVYHHSLLTWSWYSVVRLAPGGDAWYGSCYNSFIHVLMYSYYLFTTFGVRCPWKKFLTQLQMVQFVCCLTQSVYLSIYDPDAFPKKLMLLQAFVMVNMLVLFGNFYIKSYSKASKQARPAPSPPAPAPADPSEARQAAGLARPKRPAGEPPAAYYDALAVGGAGAKREFTLSEVERHNRPADAWLACRGDVYDVTSFVGSHPGGDIISLGLGRDSTILVESYHPAGRPDATLAKYRIGALRDPASAYVWDQSEFYPELKRRVIQTLKGAGAPRRGGLLLKTGLVLGLFAVSLALMVLQASFFWAAVWGLSCSLIGLNIQHDGNHGAFSARPAVSRLAGLGMDLIGASSAVWEFQHVVGHHQYTNMITDLDFAQPENDPDVFSSYPLMRMHPHTPWRPHHQFQHWYAIPLFALMTLSKVLLSDIQAGLTHKNAHIDCTPRLGRWQGKALFWGSKGAAALVQVALPCYLHGVPRGLALFGVAHAVSGLFLALCFIINHVSEACDYLRPGAAAEKSTPEMVLQAQREATARRVHPEPTARDWAAAQVRCCTNWRSESWLANHLSGGLNHQIEHHLFPSLSHVNYPLIAPVVREVCQEFGVPYKNYPTFSEAVAAMLRHLHDMGLKPPEAADKSASWDTTEDLCPVLTAAAASPDGASPACPDVATQA